MIRYRFQLFIFFLMIGLLISAASAQSTIQLTDIGPSSAIVSWKGTGHNNEAIRYRKAGTTEWIMINTGLQSVYKIINLKPKTPYEVAVMTIGDNGMEEWSASEKLLTIGRPNLLVIMADDGRYDNYAVNGGPDFFPSPNINSIAEEGANFKYCFPALSLCSPSRASLVTGTYPHHHGVFGNAVIDTMLLPTVATILHDSGYYVGLVGKYGFDNGQLTDMTIGCSQPAIHIPMSSMTHLQARCSYRDTKPMFSLMEQKIS